MKTNIATTSEQSQRLLRCGVSADTADMTLRTETGEVNFSRYSLETELKFYGYDDPKRHIEIVPAWSLSALLGLLPFKIHSGKYEYWLDIAPMDYGKQWSIGYYCMDKPRVIKGLTHTDSLIECAVQEIEWLTSNGYKLNEI